MISNRRLDHAAIHLDTNVFICFVGAHRCRARVRRALSASIEPAWCRAVTSEPTPAEALVKPMQDRRQDVADTSRGLSSPTSTIEPVPVARSLLETGARHRAELGGCAADAIHAPTAAAARCGYLVSHDLRLPLPAMLERTRVCEISIDDGVSGA